jgi:hypothetical protein
MNEREFYAELLKAVSLQGSIANEHDWRRAVLQVVEALVAGGDTYTDADAVDAIKTKPEIAALTAESDVADIVAALKA